MINLIVEKIKDSLASVPIIDRNYGLIRTNRVKVKQGDTTVEKVFPVYRNTPDGCSNAVEVDAVPNSSYKALSYHELVAPEGTQSMGNGFYEFTMSMRNVWWINSKLANYDQSNVDQFVLNVIKYFPEKLANFDDLHAIRISIQNIDYSAAVFGQWSYDEANRQYLTPPFFHFGINYQVVFRVHKDCITALTVESNLC